MSDAFFKTYLRDPYQSELEYFKNNPTVSGMAAEDDRVILNPYSRLNKSEKDSVMRNEVARILMRQNESLRPFFDVTDEQRKRFSGYGAERDIKETIAARLFSGDPSAGKSTPEQSKFVSGLIKHVEEKSRPKQFGLLDAAKQFVTDAMPGGLLNPELRVGADRGAFPVQTGPLSYTGQNHPITRRPIMQDNNGERYTEFTLTVTDPRLNRGLPTPIPSVWGGQIQDEENAIKMALQSGNIWKSYDSILEADKAAARRSKLLGLVME